MLEISNKTNLLEQKSYKYSLQDVAEPNLQRDIFSYSSVPKVAFNHRRVPMNMPEEIWITDTWSEKELKNGDSVIIIIENEKEKTKYTYSFSYHIKENDNNGKWNISDYRVESESEELED